MLLQPFLEQAGSRPQALALTEGARSLSYGALLSRAQGIALTLRVRQVGAGHRVAIFLDRGMDAVAAVFGVLLAGAAYVPLDINNPKERCRVILADGAVSAVLGRGEAPETLGEWTWIDIGNGPEGEHDTNPLPPPPEAGAPAAILYTSGSTGSPKGVVHSHGSLAAFASWAAELVGLGPQDRIASSAPLFFDLSSFDLYAALGRGASLHFLPGALSLAPARLVQCLREQAITGWYTVPSLLAFLAYKGNLEATPLPGLRFLLFAGEVFPTPSLQGLAATLPDTDLYNFYGPTETNVCCHWPVDRSRLEGTEPIPIGSPAAGDELRIDPHSGELLVRGPTLLSGYWNQGRLIQATNGAGWYATGDRVSLNLDGEYVFHERLGRMLKCAGYRVEPAEIEAAIQFAPGVRECAVVGLPDPTAGQRPAAALVLEPRGSIAEVRSELRARLPAYMQPGRFRSLDALPRLANGKLDYLRVQALLEGKP